MAIGIARDIRRAKGLSFMLFLSGCAHDWDQFSWEADAVWCSPGSVSELQDRFDDDDISPAWHFAEDGSVAIREHDGELTVQAMDVSDHQYSALATTDDYNMKDCAVFVKLASLFDQKEPAYVHFTVRNAAMDALEFGVGYDNLRMKVFRAGQEEPNPLQMAIDRDAYRYLKLREEDGTTYWEASPDAHTWRVLRSQPTSIPLDAVRVMIGGGTYGPLTAPLNVAAFDDLNARP